MKQRKLVIGLLIMVALVVSTFTFAFWGAAQDWDETIASGNVQIGTARVVTVEAEAVLPQPNQVLVPVGFINQSNEANAVSTITLTFEVDWVDSADYAEDSILTVTFANYSFGNSLTHEDIDRMFDIVATSNSTISPNVTKEVTITVTFAEQPLDADEYALVAGGNLTFNITFTVTPTLND